MISARPNIAYALSVASRYKSNPDLLHWKVVKDILKYLRRTKNLFFVYGSGELKLEGYIDSSFQSDVDDSKLTSGFVFKLNGDAVSRKSSKRDTTADSTTEAEYIAASDVANEVDPVPVYYDNTGAVAQAKEPRSHQ
ncbi:secreted RxLR effector protein 161-like [Primulina eburnea]|uniref:secreted RxLR effector protein 161-like n=1 Tax=Primulina eburnea TaxID=1245227 RepID=UPI003C6C35CA